MMNWLHRIMRTAEKSIRTAFGMHYFFITTEFDDANDALIVDLDYNQKMVEVLLKKGYGEFTDDPEEIIMEFVRDNYADIFNIITESPIDYTGEMHGG